MGHENIAKLQLVDSYSFLGDPRHIRVRERTRCKNVESTNCNKEISNPEGSPTFMQFEESQGEILASRVFEHLPIETRTQSGTYE
jgi:hypothetical protein